MSSPRQHGGRNWSACKTRASRGDVQMILRSFSRAAFALAACSTAMLGSNARAADFSAEYVFGDSLSDNGNLASIGVKFTDPPSFHDSFTTDRSRFSCWHKAWDLAPIRPIG